MKRALMVFVLFVSVVRCGSNDSGSASGDTLSLTFNPNAFQLTPGASATIGIGLSGTGGAAVTLIVDGGGLTANVSSVIADAATVTLTAPASAALTDYTVKVTAQRAGEADVTNELHGSVVQPSPTSVDVTLVDAFGFPAVSPQGRIYSAGSTQPETIVFDAQSHTRMAGVLPPYDIVATGPNFQILYLGIHSTTVTLGTTGTNGTGAPRVAQVAGSINSLATPKHTAIAALSSISYGQSEPNAESYSLSIPLTGETESVHVAALQWAMNEDGKPASYAGYVADDVPLTSLSANTHNLVLAGPVASHTVNVALASAPSGTSITSVVGVFLVEHVLTGLGQSITASSSLLVPADDRMPVFVLATAYKTGSSVQVTKAVGKDTTDVLIDVSHVATILSPANGAPSVGDGDLFEVGAVANATYIFIMSQGGPPLYAVVTSEPRMSLATLRSHGFTIPASTGFSWTAYVITDPGSETFTAARTSLGVGYATDGSILRVVGPNGFTTAP